MYNINPFVIYIYIYILLLLQDVVTLKYGFQASDETLHMVLETLQEAVKAG
jgi:hypothetical protein